MEALEITEMDALMMLSHMATGSPRTRALASLNITNEQLATYKAEMRSFLDLKAPHGGEEGGSSRDHLDSTKVPSPGESVKSSDSSSVELGLGLPKSPESVLLPRPLHQSISDSAKALLEISSTNVGFEPPANKNSKRLADAEVTPSESGAEGSNMGARPKTRVKLKVTPPEDIAEVDDDVKVGRVDSSTLSIARLDQGFTTECTSRLGSAHYSHAENFEAASGGPSTSPVQSGSSEQEEHVKSPILIGSGDF